MEAFGVNPVWSAGWFVAGLWFATGTNKDLLDPAFFKPEVEKYSDFYCSKSSNTTVYTYSVL